MTYSKISQNYTKFRSKTVAHKNLSNIIALYALLLSPIVYSTGLAISCGNSTGYSYYFEGGLVDNNNSGFSEDGIANGQFTLTINDKGEADVLSVDATGDLKSAIAQGGTVTTSMAGLNAANWFVFYPDSTIEVYSYSSNSNKTVSYRNTVGNTSIAKNSIFVSECKP